MKEKPAFDLSRRQATFALIAIVLLSTFGFSYLAYLKYASFNQFTQDSAFYGYAFFQTLHGRFFPAYMGPYSMLAVHANFLWLLRLPVFWLAPSMYTLMLYQSLTISLGAWPIYLLARRVTAN